MADARRWMLVVVAAVLVAGGGGRVWAQSKPTSGKLIVTNNLTENQSLVSILIERQLPNGKVDTTRNSVPKGGTKAIVLAYGSYSVQLSRMKLNGAGTLFKVWTTRKFELSESHPEHTVTMNEKDAAPPEKPGKGKKGPKKKQ